ncbi:hypothetical protein Tco_0326990 [Tanacetum coccineum]
MKAVDRRMKVKSKNLIQSKMKNLMMIIKKRNARLEEPTQTGKEVVQGEGADVEMNEAQQGNENLETNQEQVVDDAHVTITIVMKKTEAPTLLTISVFVITESSPVLTNIPQSSQTFTPPPILRTPTPPPIIETTNPLSTLLDFTSVFRFNDRITTLEKEVAKLKKDPLHTQLTTLVDEHLDTRKCLTSLYLPQIQPHSTYEAASTLTEFELKKILIDKMEKNFFFSYDVYSLKRSRKDKDKDEDPSAGSDQGKSVQSEEPVFEIADSDMPHDQEGNLGDNKDEPRNETASRHDWFKKPTPPQEPTDPD